jgi:hypothetical protein
MKHGSKIQVWRNKADRTPGGLTREQLQKNKKGKIVSKKASSAASRKSNLKGFLIRPRRKRKAKKKVNYKE